MKKRRKFKKILLVPPVLLAALFIWLLAGQVASVKTAGRVSRLSAERTAGSEASGKGEQALPDYDGGPGDSGKNGGGIGNEEAPDSPVTLLFGGDIYLSSHVLNAYDKAGGIGGVLDEGLRIEISSADIFMANEEFPFSDGGTPVDDKEYTFRLPVERVSVMKEIGPDIVALANNHTLDYGPDALLDTCRTLDQAGILHVGAGQDLAAAKAPVIIERKGKRIGFLAASRVIPSSGWNAGSSRPGLLTTYDPAILLEEIEALRGECDYLVVYVHWGIERQTEPEAYQRALAKQYIDAGADLVVGSHPHVLQGIEYYKDKPIVYSLGNFVFGSSIPRTALLKVELSEDMPGGRLSLIPAVSSAGFTRMLGESGRPNFFQYMEGLSFGVSIDSQGAVSH